MAKAYDPIMCMMVDEPTKAQDESYIVRGRKYKVVKRDGDNVTVIGPDGKVTKMDIDFLMSEGKKAKDSASALDKAIKACDAVEVETSEWSFSSGKSKPSGLGNWWFKIGTEEKNFYGNWSNAKAEAIKYAKEKGINRISLMT